jgi:hypothetical protein
MSMVASVELASAGVLMGASSQNATVEYRFIGKGDNLVSRQIPLRSMTLFTTIHHRIATMWFR